MRSLRIASGPPSLGPRTIDIWGIQGAIHAAVRAHAGLFHGTVLDVGCGRQPYRDLLIGNGHGVNYVGLDLASGAYDGQPDLVWDGVRIPLPDASIEGVLATEVLEHCPDPAAVLGEIGRVLKPDGVLLLTVPFLWPLHDVPNDFWRFTPFALERLLERGGFRQARIEALGGWDAAISQALGLWARRRPQPRVVRVLLSVALWPIVWLLGSRQRRGPFDEGAMITGLVALARRDAR